MILGKYPSMMIRVASPLQRLASTSVRTLILSKGWVCCIPPDTLAVDLYAAYITALMYHRVVWCWLRVSCVHRFHTAPMTKVSAGLELLSSHFLMAIPEAVAVPSMR
jgi:hypothetical protein